MPAVPAHVRSWITTEDAARGDDMQKGAPPSAGSAVEDVEDWKTWNTGTVGIATLDIHPEVARQRPLAASQAVRASGLEGVGLGGVQSCCFETRKQPYF